MIIFVMLNQNTMRLLIFKKYLAWIVSGKPSWVVSAWLLFSNPSPGSFKNVYGVG